MSGVIYQPKSNRKKNKRIDELLSNPVTGRAIIRKLMTERASGSKTITVKSNDKDVIIDVKELSLK
jgi:hypothetical protein